MPGEPVSRHPLFALWPRPQASERMRRPVGGIQLSRVNTSLLAAGAALFLAALLSRWVTIGGNQILRGAPWWVQVVLGAVGLLAMTWALAASREPDSKMRTIRGFLGVPPSMPDPDRFVERADLSATVVAAMLAVGGLVALTGISGSGKSTLAAGALLDRRVRRRFRDGVTWLEAVRGQDPVALLAELGRRLGFPESECGFTTVTQGRDKIAVALQGKRLLVAVDNVWERGPLDALTVPGCTLVFTTRMPELANAFGATQIPVDKLTQAQALELLGRWTSRTAADLPTDARALCARVGNLVLGVVMAGAMVARGRSFADVLALIEQDLARVRADLVPEYQYRNLLAAIDAGISDLTSEDQERYEQLAVFAGRGSFPRRAAWALWRLDLTQADVGDLLADLTGRSLLVAAGDDRYAANDLQYEVLKRRLGRGRLAAAHGQLLDGYRVRYPGGWADAVSDSYLAGTLASHLHDAGREDELRAVLADMAWIQARLTAGQLQGLLSDYGYAADPLTRRIGRALRLSAHVLAADSGQVRGQLTGRLLGDANPAVADWAAALAQGGSPTPWLAPLTPALTSTATGLEQVMTGHAGWVLAVAVSRHGAKAVTGGQDGTVQVWDLAAGRQQAVAHRPHRTGIRGGSQRRRNQSGHRRPGWHRAGVGPSRRTPASSTHRPHRTGIRGGSQRRRNQSGHQRPMAPCGVGPAAGRQQADSPATPDRYSRWQSAETEPERSPAGSTAPCEYGTWPPDASKQSSLPAA